MLAVSGRHAETVEFLLDNGANPNLVEGLNTSPLMQAIEVGDLAIVTALLEAGADIHYYGGDDSAVAHALRRERHELLPALETYAAVELPDRKDGD